MKISSLTVLKRNLIAVVMYAANIVSLVGLPYAVGGDAKACESGQVRFISFALLSFIAPGAKRRGKFPLVGPFYSP